MSIGQMLHEFIYIPVAAMAAEHPEIGIRSARFWRIFIFEGRFSPSLARSLGVLCLTHSVCNRIEQAVTASMSRMRLQWTRSPALRL